MQGGGKHVPCSSIPASTASSSSDSEGYLNVLRRCCAATVSASLSFSISFLSSFVDWYGDSTSSRKYVDAVQEEVAGTVNLLKPEVVERWLFCGFLHACGKATSCLSVWVGGTDDVCGGN